MKKLALIFLILFLLPASFCFSQVTDYCGVYTWNQSLSRWVKNPNDTVISTPIFIDSVHHEVHDSKMFTITDFASPVDIAAPKYWRITTPNSIVRIHFMAQVDCAAGARVEFFEAPTINGAGTGLTIYNNDRNSLATTTATAFKDTTTTADGTLITAIKVGGNFASSRIGGTARSQAEWILKQNTSYIIKVTSDANGNQVSMTMQFYEA